MAPLLTHADADAASSLAASVTVKEFSSLRGLNGSALAAEVDMAAVIDCIYTMIWSMSNSFFANLSSVQQFEQKPDVVEEYFFLIARALECCPAPFVSAVNEASSTVISGGTVIHNLIEGESRVVDHCILSHKRESAACR